MRKRKSLGLGFIDEIDKVTIASSFKKPKEESWQEMLLANFDPNKTLLDINLNRVLFFLIFSSIVFFAIFLRLFQLQVVKGKENRNIADGNRIAIRVIHASRGVIFDRNGKILAANAPGFRLIDGSRTRYISREEALELEVKDSPLAASLEIDSLRTYPRGAETAHILGYLGEVTEEQVESKKYRIGDRVGKSGIEYFYEDTLRGIDGGEIIEIDASGKKLRTLREIPPFPGKDLYLTIDSDLQHQVFIKLKEAISKVGRCCGGAVLANPTNGEILAMVSMPEFDNNVFSGNNEDSLKDILTNSNSPVLNRVIAGTYPPGSTYKIVSALAVLGSGKISAQTVFEDSGEIFLGPFKFSNWYFNQYGRKEGPVDLVKALKRSNDTYFYRVAQIIGEDALIEWSKKLKLGGKLGIDIPGEEKGLVPTNKWKEENFGASWYPGDSLHMAIGQGFVLTTPLQVLGFTSFIASDGKLYQPHFALKITDSNNKIIKTLPLKLLVSNITSKNQIEVIKKGLEEVPIDGGTAWPFFNFPIKTGGKTGTAEYGDLKNRTHGWYTAYAPADDPKIAMTVLIEGGGEGSTVASPVVKEVFRWYFSEDKKKLILDKGVVATESARILGE